MKKITLIFSLLLFSFFAQAQKLVGLSTLIQGGVSDGEKLISAYILPLNQALIVGLNNTGFNGAYEEDDTHHFSLSLNTSFINIPNKFKSFDVNSLGLESVEPKDPSQTIAQTVLGDSSTIKLTSVYGFGFTNIRLFSVNTIGGSEQNTVPLPYLNASYRVHNFTFSGQVIPPLTLPNSDIRVWLLGGSVQANAAGIVPVLEEFPLSFHLTGGYYFLGGHSDLEVIPDKVKINVPLTDDRKGPYDNQELVIKYNSFYAAIYASAKMNLFTPFLGVGYGFGFSSIQLEGTFPVFAKSNNSLFGLRAKDVENPFQNNTEYGRIKFEGGGRFDFGRFFGQVSYTLANYGGLGANVGIRF